MFREEILKNFKGKKVLVIGDFMIDEYIFGKVERISPEAPVPVVEAKEVTIKPGGAANVAANLSSLGAIPYLVGVIGKDEKGKKLKDLLQKLKAKTQWLIEDKDRPTTVKTRIVAGAQQLLRVDWENSDYVSKDVSKEIIKVLSDNYKEFDAVIISDYGKGVVTPELFEITGKIKIERPIILDPKEKNFPFYKNITTMTPNIKETFQAVGIKPETNEDTEKAGNRLIERFNLDYAVITRSEQGLSIIGRKFKKHIPTRAKQVFDVTGAGDTVISVFTLAISSGATPEEAGEIANLAAGIVVGKLGTATTTVSEILETLKNLRR
ncbi:rfaE bifunctional protein [Desulfurobacterium thermolithotrophum DSM 11699]|uniref:RfaE bifunctional protein n=1 Tax=Desulfurobacterium thermolithotrophum (strain DSM 11699 / BSA) TaxID=868864 RepID=F0S369_DESTD|nr:D-glycero-beta-D-manno-heptose-7-phosphate kinase [Desulfurobacterium thermolithotrophum]ADY73291.1 rfaE bifunctional protein [Desulfurobacterium thermolithotrophum DSM 11699]